MSRYPFGERAEEYMESRRCEYAETSWKTIMRRYRRMERDMIELKNSGKISTLSPAKMTEDDVKQYILYRKGKKNSNSEVNHDISALNNLLVYVGNVAVQKCIQRNQGIKPKSKQPRLDPLPSKTYDKILTAYDSANTDSLTEVRAFAIVLMSVNLGTRNKELRLADMSDLDTDNWVLHVKHVKGEDTYGEPRSIPVPPEIRPVILQYLLLRNKWLKSHSVESKALFFAFSGEYGYLSGNGFREIKSKIEVKIGEKFELRDCRRTFGQNYVDKGLNIEAVSVLMGHSSTKTTEGYYCRKSQADAIEQARKVW